MAFIVFEGGDGAGKSTQARALLRRLRRRSLPAILTREPGGTPLGESLRRLLKAGEGITPKSEMFLFAAARSQLVREVIRPALQNGITVICDRFSASTVAYQGYGRGLEIDLVEGTNLTATGGLTPDLTILLDLPLSAGTARKAGLHGDHFDTAPKAFQERVREGYLSQARQDPAGWLVLNATLTQRELAVNIWAKVQPLL